MNPTKAQQMMIEDGLPPEIVLLTEEERRADWKGVKLTRPTDTATAKIEAGRKAVKEAAKITAHNRRQEAMATTLEELTAKMGAENRANEAKVPAYTQAQAYAEAVFLAKWSKGARIVRQSADATFWAAGKWMTKLAANQAKSLVEHGFATLKGDVHAAGAVLIVPKPPKTNPAAPAATQENDMKKPTKKTAKKAPAKKGAKKTAPKAPAAAKPAKATPAPAAGERADGLRAGSKQAVMLDMVSKPEGATEQELCKALGWKKCRVTLKRVAEKVGATLASEKVEGRGTVYKVAA